AYTEQSRRKWVVLTSVIAVIASSASPFGPLGSFWGSPVVPEDVDPTTFQLILFGLNSLASSIIFGLGISFLIFGYAKVKTMQPASKRLTLAAYFSIVWLLTSWWPHENLHDTVGDRINANIAVDYGFHMTLMIAGVILAYFFWTLMRPQTTTSS
ncbi:MAG: hypothetical protein ACC656_06800, partial [Candidatus Heimdallarchaeota archaeon]